VFFGGFKGFWCILRFLKGFYSFYMFFTYFSKNNEIHAIWARNRGFPGRPRSFPGRSPVVPGRPRSFPGRPPVVPAQKQKKHTVLRFVCQFLVFDEKMLCLQYFK
jgi:hypothetical protein